MSVLHMLFSNILYGPFHSLLALKTKKKLGAAVEICSKGAWKRGELVDTLQLPTPTLHHRNQREHVEKARQKQTIRAELWLAF